MNEYEITSTDTYLMDNDGNVYVPIPELNEATLSMEQLGIDMPF